MKNKNLFTEEQVLTAVIEAIVATSKELKDSSLVIAGCVMLKHLKPKLQK